MVKLKWDQIGEKLYETGTSKGVLFVQDKTGAYEPGVAWNGLSSVKQQNDGAEPTDIYANDMKYLSLYSQENARGSIDAYTYPEEFEVCDGSATVSAGVHVRQQSRRAFGLAYSTILGNDTEGNAYGEKIHILYNARVSPSSRDYQTVNETPEALTLTWDYQTTPVDLSDIDLEPAAALTINSAEVEEGAFEALKDMLYGTEKEEPTLPTIQEIVELFGE